MKAIVNGHLDIVKIFYSIRYDFNESDVYGVTPLHYSINKRQQAIAEFLVKHVEIDLDAEDEVSFYIYLNKCNHKNFWNRNYQLYLSQVAIVRIRN